MIKLNYIFIVGGKIDIIKRLISEWDRGDERGKYQYIYFNGFKRISLVYLECRGRTFMWETYRLSSHSDVRYSKRFDTKEDAEEFIMEILVGDDLKGLVEWKIAKNNMAIQD